MTSHFLKNTLSAVFVFLLSTPAFASKSKDRDFIKSQVGCFEVEFNFVETLALQPGYQFHEPHKSRGLEWVGVDAESSGHVALQHILVFSNGEVQKHWRQEWDYKAKKRLDYIAPSTWQNIATKAQKGEWTQRVYQVDDGPRYECSAPVVRRQGAEYWECETWSPLPRREFSKRSDYNILQRRNRHQITNYGWVHEQDNTKILLAAGVQTPIAIEKGITPYKRVEDSRCEPAKLWWQNNKQVWNTIQAVWKDVYDRCDVLTFATPAGAGPLWAKLFTIAEQFQAQSFNKQALEATTFEAISKYLTCN